MSILHTTVQKNEYKYFTFDEFKETPNTDYWRRGNFISEYYNGCKYEFDVQPIEKGKDLFIVRQKENISNNTYWGSYTEYVEVTDIFRLHLKWLNQTVIHMNT